MRIAIAGGHGQIARLLARRLVEAGHEPHALIRKPEQATDIEADGATPVVIDLEKTDDAGLAEVLTGCDAVVFAAGSGPGSTPERKVTVSVGIVDERLETILYARVMKPRGSHVTDDSFVRTTGGLRPDWDRGVHISVAQELVRRFAETGGGVLVGWQLDSDLSALGFSAAAAEASDASGFAPNGRRAGLPLGLTSSGSAVHCDIVDLTDTF